MRFRLLSFLLGFGICMSALAVRIQASELSEEISLDNVGAVQAVAIANKWRREGKDVKSYVDSREVVFKFPDGRVKRIPLPEGKMLAAVAPYVHKTHA